METAVNLSTRIKFQVKKPVMGKLPEFRRQVVLKTHGSLENDAQV